MSAVLGVDTTADNSNKFLAALLSPFRQKQRLAIQSDSRNHTVTVDTITVDGLSPIGSVSDDQIDETNADDVTDAFDANSQSAATTSAQQFINHFFFHLTALALSLLIAILLAVGSAYESTSTAVIDISMAILGLFAVEVIIRLVAYGPECIRSSIFIATTMLTIATYLFLANAFALSQLKNLTISIVLQAAQASARVLYVSCAQSARHMVSTNKTRYTLHGYDLDLTYITPRVVAMGLPSTHIEGLYRNPIEQVVRFFDQMHTDHYVIINLCSERDYDQSWFHDRVVRFPFDDHNPCPLSTLIELCTIVDSYLAYDSRNVVAIHCKGGKGRTGTMIASYLLFSQIHVFADDALKTFAQCRTSLQLGHKLQGVSGPSQKRYVQYFEWIRRRDEVDAAIRDTIRTQQLAAQRRPMIKSPKPLIIRVDNTPNDYDIELIRYNKNNNNIKTSRQEIAAEEEKTQPINTDTVLTRVTQQTSRSPTHKASSPVANGAATTTTTTTLTPAASTTTTITSSTTKQSTLLTTKNNSTSQASPSTLIAKRKRQLSRRSQIGLYNPSPFLFAATHFLYETPKCELLRLVLHNAIIKKDKERWKGEKERHEWNRTWNHPDNWSLVITHYRPVIPRQTYVPELDEEGQRQRLNSHNGDTLRSDIERLNAYNLTRYEQTHDYYFRARPKDENDDDTSVTFDISSFHADSKSLIVGGDLKFQIFRGLRDVNDDDERDDLLTDEESVRSFSNKPRMSSSTASTKGSSASSQLTTSSGSNSASDGSSRLQISTHPPRSSSLPLPTSSGDELPPHITAPRKVSYNTLATSITQFSPKENATRLFGWFWVNTSFLPSSTAQTSPTFRSQESQDNPEPSEPTPSELILRKNQLDSIFKDDTIDSECNVYVYYHLPPRHPEAKPVEEIHRQVRERMRAREENDRILARRLNQTTIKNGYVINDEAKDDEVAEVKEEEDEVKREAESGEFVA